MKKQQQLRPGSYKSGAGFMHHYQELVKKEMIPYQYDVLWDRIPDTEKSHVIANFLNAAKLLKGEKPQEEFYGMVFQDSDLAKWIEAAAFSLLNYPDAQLEDELDDVIRLIGDAQDSDGYLNTYFTLNGKEKRFKDLLEGHELYCSGHMIEAAVAYDQATGKDSLLKIMSRNVDCIYHHFVEEKAPGFPGHPEIELALLKMYHWTGNKKCLELAEHFINVRGVDTEFYEKEAAARDWGIWGNDPKNGEYQQSHMPVREMKDAVGHSVRAVYLYTAMADLASLTDEAALLDACRTLWKSIVNRQMYVTGAIGSTVIGEAFTKDYNLPNDTVYGETCASIGLMFFASRMLEMEPDREYSDVMERAFYNTVLAGIQLDGRHFFYVNPLEAIPGISEKAQTHRHSLIQRPSWYACACCPPNAARLIESIGMYAYGENETTGFCHLIAEGEVTMENGLAFSCETKYPYDFTITYRIKKGGKTLALRIPGWSHTWSAQRNGISIQQELVKGYLYTEVSDGDVITLRLDDSIRHIYASSKVAADTGYTCIQRGPLVYCLEGVDHDGDVLSLRIKEDGFSKALPYDKDLLSGIVPLELEGYRSAPQETLYSDRKPEQIPCTLRAIPYYTWANRGVTQMRVWIPEAK
ncbi:MAG TPA: glycoside hydrolase family 127 protein [Candidatus Choladousia intestinigallinarum]|nr:glycoside hydrolase family 127 protein [Candidatus Choladousia intestinigallinarum]